MNFGVDKVRAAVVGIDLHRGHLDMAVATVSSHNPVPRTNGLKINDSEAARKVQPGWGFASKCRLWAFICLLVLSF